MQGKVRDNSGYTESDTHIVYQQERSHEDFDSRQT